MKPIHTILMMSLLGLPALGQSTELILDDPTGVPDQAWAEAVPAGAVDADTAALGEAAGLLAGGKHEQAKSILDGWIAAHERSDHPLLGRAYALRGDAWLGLGREYKALFDYEKVCQDFSNGPEFVHAVQREFEIGKMYLDGLRRRFLWMRLETGRPTGEELVIRVQERLPGSALAEEAAITLADYYYDRRQMKLAAEMYGIFLHNYPKSTHREKAMLREIYCNVGRFKGPRYDAAGLVEARLLIEDFRTSYPAGAEAAGITEGLVTRIDESEALQMLDTANWYLKQHDEPSARLVLKRMLRKHPESAASGEAVRIMIDKGWLREPTPGEAIGHTETRAEAEDRPGMATLKERLLTEPKPVVEEPVVDAADVPAGDAVSDPVLDDIFAVPESKETTP